MSTGLVGNSEATLRPFPRVPTIGTPDTVMDIAMDSPSYDAILPAPFGAMGVTVAGDRVSGLAFLPPGTSGPPPATPLLRRVAKELAQYYADPAHRFSLPLIASGTAFRQRVWNALMDIPAGQTISYGELARRVDSAPRAVGQAVGDNPIPIIIPCHRVVAADGSLGGFNHSRVGFSQGIKRWLLEHERALPAKTP